MERTVWTDEMLDKQIQAFEKRTDSLVAEMQAMRLELKTELHAVRDELRGEIVGLRDELRGEIGGVRDELHREISGVRGEIGGVRGEIGGVRADLTAFHRQMMFIVSSFAIALFVLFGTTVIHLI